MSTPLFSRIALACIGALLLSCLLACSSTRPVAAHAVRCNVSHSYHK